MPPPLVKQDCNLKPNGAAYRCTCCGWRYHKTVHRNCPKPCFRGLGDAVAWGLRKLGFKKKCGGCRKRQALLNKAVPFPSLSDLASEHSNAQHSNDQR